MKEPTEKKFERILFLHNWRSKPQKSSKKKNKTTNKTQQIKQMKNKKFEVLINQFDKSIFIHTYQKIKIN